MPQTPPDTSAETLAVRMQLIGANPNADVAGLDELPGKVNYLHGNDPKRWQTDVATYGKVKLSSVYEGVDLVYYGNGRQLEYDFIVASGADPNAIRLNFSDTDNARLDATGDLLLHTQDGELRLQKPVVYQTIGGKRQNVDGRFVLYDVAVGEGQSDGKSRQVGFQVAAYDVSQPLVIDPVLVYSSYLGGSGGGDVVNGIAVDSTGNVYITGNTPSSDFPTINAKYPNFRGYYSDAFVTKFSADGSKVLYSTYLGGSDSDYGNGIAVDASGNAYVIGYTGSSNFPTMNAKYPFLRGLTDAFVVKFSVDGSQVLYSTYLGGSYHEWGNGIAVDSVGSVYVTGLTDSFDFPTANALYPQFQGGTSDAFVTKLSSNGQKLIYSTYLGGANDRCCATVWLGHGDMGTSIAVDSAGNAYVTGDAYSSDFPIVNAKYPNPMRDLYDVFVTKLNRDGQRIIYSTYLGGNDWENGTGIAVDNIGNAYVTGWTTSVDFPTINAKYPALRGTSDVFVTKFNATGTQVLYSSYLGGGNNDEGNSIAVDSVGNAYIAGYTHSSDFPKVNAKYPSLRGTADAFVVKFSAEGSKVLYSTYLGGNGVDQSRGIAVDGSGNAYVAGTTNSCDFPTAATDPKIISWDTNCNGGADAFVTKLSATDTSKPFLLTPSSHDFGAVTLGQRLRHPFMYTNTGATPLNATSVVGAPYKLLTGASFTLAPGASQPIWVEFAPVTAGVYEKTLVVKTAAGTIIAPLKGIGAPLENRVPVISPTALQGVPGEVLTLRGNHFGPMGGSLSIDGVLVKPQSWYDTFITFTVPAKAPGVYALNVMTATGTAGGTLEVLSNTPAINKLSPSYGPPGTTVVVNGRNFGLATQHGTVKIGGVAAQVLEWSDKRLQVQVPSVPLALTTLDVKTSKGLASAPFRVRNLMLVPQYSDCDRLLIDLCPVLAVSVVRQNSGGTEVDVLLDNYQSRWYSVTIYPANATVPGPQQIMVAPNKTLRINGITIAPGAQIRFFADATATNAKLWQTVDMLYRIAITWVPGVPQRLSPDDMDLAVTYLKTQTTSPLYQFVTELTANLVKGDKLGVFKQVLDLPALINDDPAVQYFLINYFKFSPQAVAKLAVLSWISEAGHLLGVIADTIVQMLTPRFGTAVLVEK